MPNPVVHFEIIGRDLRLLEGFYKQVFDWQITSVMSEYSMVNAGSGIPGGIGAMGQEQSYVTFYVEVDDVGAALALIESKGGQKVFGPHTVPTGATIAGFTDPEGHLVGLVQQPAKA